MEATTGLMGSIELFVRQLIPVVGSYEPDIEALRASSTRVLVGVGDVGWEPRVKLDDGVRRTVDAMAWRRRTST
jgi:hypothetical protein